MISNFTGGFGRLHVTADGAIILNGHDLTQRDCIVLAENLIEARRDSIDRYQRKLPSYYDSAAILARSEMNEGQALTALRRIH
jgi:hypothetical protein